jgi:ureidoglycolate lyase
MTTVTVRELELAAFEPYGTFTQMVDNPRILAALPRPVVFRPDMIQLPLADSSTASFSICRVEPRELVITGGEYHDHASEGILPLDTDILIHVAPPTHPRVGIPVDQFEVFRVPMGTMVVLRPGTWHGAPYVSGNKPANVLVVLPVRTYAVDSTSLRLEPEQQIGIEGA